LGGQNQQECGENDHRRPSMNVRPEVSLQPDGMTAMGRERSLAAIPEPDVRGAKLGPCRQADAPKVGSGWKAALIDFL
jgi:hypothetical protein